MKAQLKNILPPPVLEPCPLKLISSVLPMSYTDPFLVNEIKFLHYYIKDYHFVNGPKI